jgi:EAL domain-containing protein (putative c-di-GMP-specific phosphodiesterase class I)
MSISNCATRPPACPMSAPSRSSTRAAGLSIFLRQWPIPNIEATDRDFFKASEWILREACREATSCLQRLKITVNISSVQFRHGDLPRLVHSILLETGLAPDRLKLEITEAVLIDNISRAISTLGKLKAPGVDIAMGVFGAGYSSLSYLHAFPFDKIKIDRTFWQFGAQPSFPNGCPCD